jgi:hypothetical protein
MLYLEAWDVFPQLVLKELIPYAITAAKPAMLRRNVPNCKRSIVSDAAPLVIHRRRCRVEVPHDTVPKSKSTTFEEDLEAVIKVRNIIKKEKGTIMS